MVASNSGVPLCLDWSSLRDECVCVWVVVPCSALWWGFDKTNTWQRSLIDQECCWSFVWVFLLILFLDHVCLCRLIAEIRQFRTDRWGRIDFFTFLYFGLGLFVGGIELCTWKETLLAHFTVPCTVLPSNTPQLPEPNSGNLGWRRSEVPERVTKQITKWVKSIDEHVLLCLQCGPRTSTELLLYIFNNLLTSEQCGWVRYDLHLFKDLWLWGHRQHNATEEQLLSLARWRWDKA